MQIKIPTDRAVTETDVSYYWIDDEGILISVSKPSCKDYTVESTKVIAENLRVLGKGKKLNVIAFLDHIGKSGKETRDYVAAEFPKYVNAWAMVINKPFIKFSLNIFLALFKHFPMKVFTNEKDARLWIAERSEPSAVDNNLSEKKIESSKLL